MQETAVSILEELASNEVKGQPFTMFTEFTRNERRQLSSVIESIDYLLDNKMVSPRFAYPGMERISISLSEKGRKLLAELDEQKPPLASDLIA
ncbi:MAG: hypothetical protein M3R04_05785 [bacterium]|nr:hypothetical protein [bacterium]